jgi:hypothetical protein
VDRRVESVQVDVQNRSRPVVRSRHFGCRRECATRSCG